MNLHIRILSGSNGHHIAEAMSRHLRRRWIWHAERMTALKAYSARREAFNEREENTNADKKNDA